MKKVELSLIRTINNDLFFEEIRNGQIQILDLDGETASLWNTEYDRLYSVEYSGSQNLVIDRVNFWAAARELYKFAKQLDLEQTSPYQEFWEGEVEG